MTRKAIHPNLARLLGLDGVKVVLITKKTWPTPVDVPYEPKQ